MELTPAQFLSLPEAERLRLYVPQLFRQVHPQRNPLPPPPRGKHIASSKAEKLKAEIVRFGFGPREAELYKALQEKAKNKTVRGKEVACDSLVVTIYGYDADPTQATKRFACLRQLKEVVNRKLAEHDQRQVLSSRAGYMYLHDPGNPPEEDGRELRKQRGAARALRIPKASAAPTMRRRGMSLGECTNFLKRSIEDGINRSSDLWRLCHEERGCSRKTFFKARKHLKLIARKCTWRSPWFLFLPPDLTSAQKGDSSVKSEASAESGGAGTP